MYPTGMDSFLPFLDENQKSDLSEKVNTGTEIGEGKNAVLLLPRRSV